MISERRMQQIWTGYLNELRISSCKKLIFQVLMLCKFEQQYFVHLKHVEKLGKSLTSDNVQFEYWFVSIQNERTHWNVGPQPLRHLGLSNGEYVRQYLGNAVETVTGSIKGINVA